MSNSSGEVDSNWMASFADLMSLLLVFFVIQLSPQAIKSDKEEEQQEKLKGAIADVEEYLKTQEIDKDVQITMEGNSALIVLPDALLFSSGKAKLDEQQKNILSGVADKLKILIGSHQIDIEGHTDSMPIATKLYPSNWYLSSARSLEVLQVFINLGFNQFHLSSQGFGEFRPLTKDKDKEGRDISFARKKNRRVSIKIVGLENLKRIHSDKKVEEVDELIRK
jgi:chemotaxis protein MotB